MGRIADRVGTRWTVICGALMIGLGLSISTLGPPWPLWIGHGLFIGSMLVARQRFHAAYRGRNRPNFGVTPRARQSSPVFEGASPDFSPARLDRPIGSERRA